MIVFLMIIIYIDRNDKEKYYQNFFLIAADKYNFNVIENSNFLLIDLNKYNEEKTFEELHQIYNEEIKKSSINICIFIFL